MTSDGKLIKKGQLDRYSLKQQGEAQSKQIPDDRFEKEYKGDILKPPYSLETLAQLPEMSTWHYRACNAKAMDVVGHGYYLEPVEKLENPSEQQKQDWQDFTERCEAQGTTLDEILFRFAYDYETLGNGIIELIRMPGEGTEGHWHSISHMPAHTVRRHTDKKVLMHTTDDTVEGSQIYIQKRGNNKSYFKRAGAEFDIHCRTGNVYPLGHLSYAERGNEVLHTENYTNKSDYYGLPDIMPALPAILGDREAQMYNVDFFENHGVPDYAVTVTGADLDSDTEDIIHDYFQNKVKETRRSTLVLTATKEQAGMGNSDPIEIKFHKLSTEIKDGSFKLYRQDNRDEILSANGVPPYRASLALVGSLGGDLAKDMDEIYKENIVDYRQTVIEKRFNTYLLKPLGITDWKLRFVEFDTASAEKEDEKRKDFFDRGSLTPNELREYQGKEPIDEPGMNSFYIQGQPIAGPLSDKLQQAQKSQEATANSLASLRQDLREVVRKDAQ